MDFYIKMHKVFNIQYNPKLKAVMHFFDCFIYKQTTARRQVPKKYHSIGQELVEMAADAP